MCLRLFVMFGLTISFLKAVENAGISQIFENKLRYQNDPLVLTGNGDIEAILRVLLKDHVTLKAKFEKIDEEHRVLQNDILNLRRQNENLEKQLLNLQNITDQKSKCTKCKCKQPIIRAPVANETVSDINTGDITSESSTPGDVPRGSPCKTFSLKEESVIQKPKEKRLLLQRAVHSAPIKFRTQQLTAKPHPALLITAPTPSYARVAFHARLSTILHNLGDNQHIDFKNVITNIGNAYNSVLATFVCPVSGTYVFFLTMVVAPDKYLETEIVRNGNNIAYNYNFDVTHSSSSSNMVIVDLQQNDAVWVRVHGNKHHSGDLGNADWSTFSGFLLWQ